MVVPVSSERVRATVFAMVIDSMYPIIATAMALPRRLPNAVAANEKIENTWLLLLPGFVPLLRGEGLRPEVVALRSVTVRGQRGLGRHSG